MRRRSVVFVLILSAARSNSLIVEGGNVQTQNVFGWQKQKKKQHTQSPTNTSNNRPRPCSLLSDLSSQSPLRRSENVFGWQKAKPTKSTSTKSDDNIIKRRKKVGVNVNAQRIQHTSSSSISSTLHRSSNNDEENYESADNINSNNSLSPPNVKVLQPRKKELWLPWPLGAMRSDFYKFSEEFGSGRGRRSNNARQEWHPRGSSSSSQEYHIISQGKEFATNILRRGESMLSGISNSNNKEHSSSQQDSDSYWIKDTTTSMAAASATMNNKKKQKNRNNKKTRHNGAVRGGESTKDDGDVHKNFDKDVLCQYLKLQASVRLRQLGYVGSDVSVHLPPAAPILLFYYMLPSKQDPIRRLVKYSVFGAGLSWIHSEVTKYRRFSPLPSMKGMNVRMPNLPPFLPSLLDHENSEVAAASSSSSDKKKGSSTASKMKNNRDENKSKDNDDEDSSHHNLWDPFSSFGTISSAYRSWLEGYNLRNQLAYQERRKRTQEELLELQKQANYTGMSSEMGYALVTGASSGIGRALAVELARYHIPLILVARDLTKLSAVAKEIETYYDIPCRILQADLNSPDCANRIHTATTSAGLNVDILVNNAGVCAHGDFLEGDIDDMMRMIQVNIGAVTQLSRLYGRDMKERRRGRILLVSSMSGVLPGNPSVAVYAATKAYEKSLASSMGREMERYGVGVTCVLPGAVKETSFASRSNIEEAACFHFPGYAKSPELVAGEGIQSLMLGYPESYPGWQNRAFTKTLLPMLPPRFSTMIGEWAWNPWQWGDVTDVMPSRKRLREDRVTEQDQLLSSSLPSTTSSVPSHTWKFPRLTSHSNEMKLPGLPQTKVIDDEPAELKTLLLVDPAIDAAPLDQNTTTITTPIEKKPDDGGSNNSAISSLPSAISPSIESEEKRTTMPPIPGDDSPKAVLLDKVAVSGGEEATDRDPKANVDKDPSTVSPEEYPSMMDNKDYDFRDRRQDY